MSIERAILSLLHSVGELQFFGNAAIAAANTDTIDTT